MKKFNDNIFDKIVKDREQKLKKELEEWKKEQANKKKEKKPRK